ncbi:hypothetical protein BH10PAT3_BH10PAT3_2010 [soil metagenome]
MDKKAQIKELWQSVYDLIRGPGRLQTILGNSTAHLTPKFDEELLNDISLMQKQTGDELHDSVAAIRSEVGLAQSMGLFGKTDLERINVLLDKIV